MKTYLTLILVFFVKLATGSCLSNGAIKYHSGSCVLVSSISHFAPPALSGGSYVMWADAVNSVVTQSGGRVSSISDMSSNSRNLLQATFANQPTYSATGLNGKPCLVGDGANAFMATSANMPASMLGDFASGSVTMVIQEASTVTDNALFGWGPAGTRDSWGNYTYMSSYTIGAGGGNNYFPNGGRSTSPQVISFVKTGPGGLSTHTLVRLNGVTQTDKGGSSALSTTVTATALYLGQWCTYTGTRFQGKIGAIVVTTSSTLSDIQLIENALNATFGGIF